MYCAISGEVPLEPVVSRVSGHVFERRLIVKALEASQGVCPATGGELKTSDLLPIKADLCVRPRPLTATSLPGMLATFQNEWDDVMLESHETKRQLYATRKELSHALYQYDGSCRVIARLMKERDQARETTAQLQEQLAKRNAEFESLSVAVSRQQQQEATTSQQQQQQQQPREAEPAEEKESSPMEVEEGLPADVEERLTAYWKMASKKRMKRPTPPGLVKKEDLAKFTKQQVSLKNATCVCASNTIVVVGFSDGSVGTLDDSGTFRASEKNDASRRESSVLSVSDCGQNLFLSCSAETLDVYRLTENKSLIFLRTLKTSFFPQHLAGAAAHPANSEFCVVGASDGGWAFCRLLEDDALAVARGLPGDRATAPLKIHPDGLILAAPCSSNQNYGIRVWELKARQKVHSFDAHEADVLSVAFSENGYYMASASKDATVRVFDLRKLAELHKVSLATVPTCVTFDFSGKYLAYAHGLSLQIDLVKEWANLATLPLEDDTKAIAFGPDANYIAAAGRKAIDLFFAPASSS